MTFSLPALPYAKDALAPHVSEETINYHYGKHHQAYVNKLNDLVKGTDLESKTLEEVILTAAKDEPKAGLFNNAAQVWNHTFYWKSMKPQGGGKPSGALADAIERDFGSFDEFKTQFKAKGAGRFGSGWAWLVIGTDGKLAVCNTLNADLPMAHGKTAILTMDVWEHAYYLDYQNSRPNYMEAFLDNLVNWEFAAENFDAAQQKQAA